MKYEMEGILAHVQDLDVEQLSKLGEAVEKAVESEKEKKIEEVRRKVIVLAASVNMTPKQLFARKVGVTHIDPLDKENIWRNSGRGRRPNWLKKYLDKGWTLDKFLIDYNWQKRELDKLRKVRLR